MASIIENRYKIQTLSAQIHRELSGPQERQCNCLRSPNNNSDAIELFKSKDSKRAYYSGLQTCGSVYSCPICSVKITEARKKEVEELLEKTKDYHHYFITLTVPHYIQETCFDILYRFKTARRKMKKWDSLKSQPEFKPYTKTLKHYRYDGSVTTIDVTYGRNGWHIHSHELIITKDPIKDLREFRKIVYENWTKAVLFCGFQINKPGAFYERSVDIEELRGDHLAKLKCYMTKASTIAERDITSWGIEAEMTKGQIKKAEGKNLTPFGMLHLINNEADPYKRKRLYARYASIFFEYCKAFKGTQMIHFSKGLKAKYNMVDKLDQDLVKSKSVKQLLVELHQAETKEKAAEIQKKLDSYYGYFEKPEWALIKRLRLRGWVIINSHLTWDELREKLNNKIKNIKLFTRGLRNDSQTKNQTLLKNTG